MTAKDLITLPRYLSVGPSSTFDLTKVIQAVFGLSCSCITTVWSDLAQFTFFVFLLTKVVDGTNRSTCVGNPSVEVPSRLSQYVKVLLKNAH